jgi:hypothetical protein
MSQWYPFAERGKNSSQTLRPYVGSSISCFCAVTTGHDKYVAGQTGRNSVLRWTKSAVDPDKGNWETIALNPLQRQ